MSDDLMNGVIFYHGRTYGISELDIAILEDLGASGTPRPIFVGDANPNTLVGTARGDLLSGLQGNDILTGGPSSDIFIFDTAIRHVTNVDRLSDFDPVDDGIQLAHAIFGRLPVGSLRHKAFHVGSAAHDHSDHIIYNTRNGKLWYDKNGDTSGKATLFARLPEHLHLTEDDFFVV